MNVYKWRIYTIRNNKIVTNKYLDRNLTLRIKCIFKNINKAKDQTFLFKCKHMLFIEMLKPRQGSTTAVSAAHRNVVANS